MATALRNLDALLRGDATREGALTRGEISLPAKQMAATIAGLGVLYGACMGSFAVVTGRGGGLLQMGAAMVKVPALFFLTLAVTFPSLYVFNALVGSRLTVVSVARLILAAMSIMLALLASFGTIVAFFSFTTDSYPFVVLLNVAVFAVSGLLGLTFLLRTLQRLTAAQDEASAPGVDAARPPILPADFAGRAEQVARGKPIAGALVAPAGDRGGASVRTVFRIWIILFGLVGSQMSWVLRPFIGSGTHFAVFRPKGSNFFESVASQIGHVFGGGGSPARER